MYVMSCVLYIPLYLGSLFFVLCGPHIGLTRSHTRRNRNRNGVNVSCVNPNSELHTAQNTKVVSGLGPYAKIQHTHAHEWAMFFLDVFCYEKQILYKIR